MCGRAAWGDKLDLCVCLDSQADYEPVVPPSRKGRRRASRTPWPRLAPRAEAAGGDPQTPVAIVTAAQSVSRHEQARTSEQRVDLSP